MPARQDDPFRLEMFARATNVLNVVNPQNFSGVIASPVFGLPTSAATARRVVVGTQSGFEECPCCSAFFALLAVRTTKVFNPMDFQRTSMITLTINHVGHVLA